MAFVRRLLCMAALAGAADVYYTLDLTWETGSPNGLERDLIFVNNQFPGPPMILDEGDDVTVRTGPIRDEGISDTRRFMFTTICRSTRQSIFMELSMYLYLVPLYRIR